MIKDIAHYVIGMFVCNDTYIFSIYVRKFKEPPDQFHILNKNLFRK